MKRLLDSDPQREAVRQNRILDVATRRFSREFEAVIRNDSLKMLDQFESTGTVPPLPIDHKRRIEAVYADLAGVTVQAFGDRILGQGKALGFDLERKAGWAEFFQRLAADWISGEAIRRRITMVSESTRNNIIRIVSSGQDAGASVEVISRNLRSMLPAISRYRAHIIARTETHGAANYASDGAARATGLELQKEWVSVEDHRTRDFGEGDGVVDEYSHRAMNGQVVEMDQPFKMPWRVGGSIDAMFPGDPSLPAGAAINCRCAVSHIVKGL